MKALSLLQPWASLVAMGAKRWETRSWRTPYTGEIAIHASKGFGEGGRTGFYETLNQPHYKEALRRWGMERRDELERGKAIAQGTPLAGLLGLTMKDVADALPLGAIVATARIVRCISTKEWIYLHGGEEKARELPEHAFGGYGPRRHAWQLADVHALPYPVECKGALSLWEVPEKVVGCVETQLKGAAGEARR